METQGPIQPFAAGHRGGQAQLWHRAKQPQPTRCPPGFWGDHSFPSPVASSRAAQPTCITTSLLKQQTLTQP